MLGFNIISFYMLTFCGLTVGFFIYYIHTHIYIVLLYGVDVLDSKILTSFFNTNTNFGTLLHNII